MTEAIFGLIGVVIGSAIAWVAEIWRARRHDSDEGRVAARLVIDELQSIDNVRTVDEKEAAELRDRALRQDAWLQHRAVLARELSYDRWRAVRRAYDVLSSPQRSPTGEKYVDEQYAKAMAALQPLASRHRYWWQRLGARLRPSG
jgi:MoxR-like ATPase